MFTKERWEELKHNPESITEEERRMIMDAWEAIKDIAHRLNKFIETLEEFENDED